MNTIAIRRTWLKHRCWAKDALAGAGFVVFCIASFWLLDFVAAALQSAQGIN